MMVAKNTKALFSSCTFMFLFFLVLVNQSLHAQIDPQSNSTDELKFKIEEKNKVIKQIEEEIRQYNIEVENASKVAKTLQSTIKTLDLTKNKLSKDINLTENKISKADLNIQKIGGEINDAQVVIDVNKKAVINAIREVNFSDSQNLVTLILGSRNLSQIWSDLDETLRVSDIVRKKTKDLLDVKTKMEKSKKSLEIEKNSLSGLKKELSGKKVAVEYTKKEKSNILVQTKSKEQAFKQLVKIKEEEKAQFEKEVYEFESQLNILIDKGSYPSPKNGILLWPLDDVFVTQKFGKTVGAEKLYASGSHNGVDFRASIGTKVKNVLTGTVVGTGNTDAYPGCYSFGKWVMVKHDNGLSTIYGHLSSINITKGERVSTGELIGFSGNTGYSTGPHLHVSVYATQGVRIEQYVNSRGCKQAILPLADVKAYLDPLAYLPTI
ncbi:MAG: peptidoglycan DD-metalloendopeptidase family protein [Minisyncoccia bacterium]